MKILKKIVINIFDGFVRANKQVGTRNYIGLISTVNCSATVVKKIAQRINNFLKNKNYENNRWCCSSKTFIWLWYKYVRLWNEFVS